MIYACDYLLLTSKSIKISYLSSMCCLLVRHHFNRIIISPYTPGGTYWIYDLFMLGHFLRESSVEQDQGKLDTRPGKLLHNYG